MLFASVIFSSPVLKAQVSFSDVLSVFSYIFMQTFHILIFSNTTWLISTKLGTNQSLWSVMPFLRGDNKKKQKYQNYKINFFSP